MNETLTEIVGRWRRYRDRRDKDVEWHAWESLGPLQDEGDEFVLLWSLALEVDEHRATRTGEKVCRACGGRGDVRRFILTTSGPFAPAKRCTCDGPTRPHTVSLRRLVSTLAAMRSPVVTDWPESWMVNRDRMEAAHWGEVTLPGDDRPTPAWVCQWWRAFGEWTATGKVSDVVALAKALASRIKPMTVREGPFVAVADEHIGEGQPLTIGDVRIAVSGAGRVVSVGSPPAPHWVGPRDTVQWFDDVQQSIARSLSGIVIDPDSTDQQRTATAHRLLGSADMGERILAALWLRMDMVEVDPPDGSNCWPDEIEVVLDPWQPLRTRSFRTMLTVTLTQVVMLDGCADEREMVGRWLDRLPERMMQPRRPVTP